MKYRGFTIRRGSEPWLEIVGRPIEYFRGDFADDTLKTTSTEIEAMGEIDELIQRESHIHPPEYVFLNPNQR